MKYIVYITINLCNGKFYIGVHRTDPNYFDGYIGDGIYRQSNATKDFAFHRAVRKYGYKNFKRTIIRTFEDSKEGRDLAFKLEKILVNPTLLRSNQCYNTAIGGEGSTQSETKKTVYMYDLNGNYIRSFSSTRDAARFFSNEEDQETIRAGIKNVCQGTSNSCHNYYFSYKKEFGYKSNGLTPVAQYTLSGQFLRSFRSISEAESEMSLSTIDQAIKKGCQAGGYQWRKYTGDNSNISKLLNYHTKLEIIPIIMYDKQMNKIAEYSSVKECVKQNPELSTSQISRVLKGIIKSHKGYIFKVKTQSELTDNSQITS